MIHYIIRNAKPRAKCIQLCLHASMYTLHQTVPKAPVLFFFHQFIKARHEKVQGQLQGITSFQMDRTEGKTSLLSLIPTAACVLTCYPAFHLTFYLANLEPFYLQYVLMSVWNILAFLLAFYLTDILTFCLASHLARVSYLPHILKEHLAC